LVIKKDLFKNFSNLFDAASSVYAGVSNFYLSIGENLSYHEQIL